MSIGELEQYLQQLLVNDFSVRSSQEKMVAINNMITEGRNIMNLQSAANSEMLNDSHKFSLVNKVNELENTFINSAMQRLASFGISVMPQNGMYGMNPMMGGQMNPMMNPYMQPQMNPMMNPYMQPQMNPMMNQQFNMQPQMGMQQPMGMQPQMPQPQMPQQAPVAPAPMPAAPVVAPKPAAAPVKDDLDEPYEPEKPSSGGGADMGMALPGMGGGDGKPAPGRDFLLDIISKKNG